MEQIQKRSRIPLIIKNGRGPLAEALDTSPFGAVTAATPTERRLRHRKNISTMKAIAPRVKK